MQKYLQESWNQFQKRNFEVRRDRSNDTQIFVAKKAASPYSLLKQAQNKWKKTSSTTLKPDI